MEAILISYESHIRNSSSSFMTTPNQAQCICPVPPHEMIKSYYFKDTHQTL